MSTTEKGTTTRGVAEHLLETLRLLDGADDNRLARENGGAYGDVREALIKVLETQGWGPRMADAAILHAMLDGCSMFDAMLATSAA